MIYVLALFAVPPIMWVTIGVTFTILNYLQFIVQQENTMSEVIQRDRLIRYTKLDDPARPNLLSMYDKEKNLQQIDRYLAEILPKDMRQHLEMSEREFTQIVDDGLGLRFGDYGVTPQVTIQ